MTEPKTDGFENIRSELKAAFVAQATPALKKIFPKGSDADITAVMEGEFEVFDRFAMADDNLSDKEVEAIHAEAERKLNPYYKALRIANGLINLSDADEAKFNEKMSDAIGGSFDRAHMSLMREAMVTDQKMIQAMLGDMLSPSSPDGQVMEIGFGTIDTETGEVQETVIRPPGGIMNSDNIH